MRNDSEILDDFTKGNLGKSVFQGGDSGNRNVISQQFISVSLQLFPIYHFIFHKFGGGLFVGLAWRILLKLPHNISQRCSLLTIVLPYEYKKLKSFLTK